MSDIINILMLGDVVGRPGRKALIEVLPSILKKEKIVFTVANGENSSGGKALIKSSAEDLFKAGVNVITSGNHVWSKSETYKLLAENGNILRPHNYPSHLPGSGKCIFTLNNDIKIGVINLQGRVYMPPIDSPFTSADTVLKEFDEEGVVVKVVDFHAEATSEKEALGFYLDGRVSVLAGTHTHVQTSDEKIYDKGMAYITDLGRCGSFNSVLGMNEESSIRHFLTSIPQPYAPKKGEITIEGLIASVDVSTGKALSVKRIREQA